MLGAAKSYLVFGEVDAFATVTEKLAAIDGEAIRSVAEDVFAGVSSLTYR